MRENYRDLIKSAPFYGVLFMENIFPHEVRRIAYSMLKSFVLSVGIVFISNELLRLGLPVNKIAGSFFVLLGSILVIFSMESFFASYYGENEARVSAGKIFYSSRGDIAVSFLNSRVGRKFILRSEISPDNIDKFIKSRNAIDHSVDLSVNIRSGNEILDVRSLGLAILDQDVEFRNFLFGAGIDRRVFSQIIDWAVADLEKDYRRELWWSPEYLSKIPGIAKDWAFGRLYYLIKYGKDLATEIDAPSVDFDVKEFKDEVRQLESILGKGRESNAILIGEPGVGIMDAVLEFVRKLSRGKVSPSLEHKRVLSLNWNNLISSNKDKIGLEAELIRVLNEAVSAGNIILVIDDLPGFVLSAETLGVNIQSLIDPYLGSYLRFIATTDRGRFHKLIEPNGALMRRFDKIKIDETDENKTIVIIENTVRKIEKKKGIRFSYPAVEEIVRGAGQYFPGAVVPDSAIDLLFEILNSVGRKHNFISRNDVLDFIEMKTKIPLGKMEGAEKEKLLHLESFLHDKIIGQDEAVSSISNAMRRTRADIRNAKKPIGTFLFFGPTGVGKTETAKALASVFFGDEKYMLRLDMTEYQKADSLERLIGSFGAGKPGVLSSMLRENPYGVLLLDEFEKADKDVLNLFLQILDEGFFSDMDGKKVSLKNTMIIATSNAASDYIFELVKDGKDLLANKDAIIKRIVDNGIFRPELINRFDSSVIFKPLVKKELAQVAKLMLKKFGARLGEKGINFVVTDELSEAVAALGSDEIFGARPMNRFIQDNIEQSIAKKIISGEVSAGSKIQLNPQDLKNKA